MKPNNQKQVWLVTSWEFMHFFKWKQELISKLIMIAIAVLVIAWQYIKDDNYQVYRIAVTDQQIALSDTNKFKFHSQTINNGEENNLLVGDDAFDGVLSKVASDEQQAQLLLTVQDKQSWHNQLNSEIKDQFRLATAKQFNLADEQLTLLENPVEIKQNYTDEAIKADDEVSDTVAVIMIMLMAVGIFTSFGQLFASITGEKQQRVTEQLYSCISAQTWIDGKILGQLLHAIKAMVTAGVTGLLGFAFMAVIIDGGSFSFADIDWSFIPWLLVFSLLGIYISTAFIASIAAAIDDPNHSAKTSMMLLPLVPIILTFITMDDASGWALSLLSYLPITSFVAMPVKMSLIDVPLWQTMISIVLSFGLAYWLRKAAARMFKMGMTMYGKEPDITTMMVWMIKEPK